MTSVTIIATGLASLAAGSLLAILFAMYRNPLFEVYLAQWGLC